MPVIIIIDSVWAFPEWCLTLSIPMWEWISPIDCRHVCIYIGMCVYVCVFSVSPKNRTELVRIRNYKEELSRFWVRNTKVRKPNDNDKMDWYVYSLEIEREKQNNQMSIDMCLRVQFLPFFTHTHAHNPASIRKSVWPLILAFSSRILTKGK